MTCVNAYDTITQADGTPLANHFDYTDTEHLVRSYCRTSDGTWIAWISPILGDAIETFVTQERGDTNKADWPSSIASAAVIGVGFFPDDESTATVYELSIDPAFTWNTVGVNNPDRDPCSIYPLLGDHYADADGAQIAAWTMDILDLQVRTDGTNVWVVALAREDVRYPWLANNPAERDRCGIDHAAFVAIYNDDPFFHDEEYFWNYQPGFFGSGLGNLFPSIYPGYDDPGDNKSFRWHPARVTVWCGDIGGFTRLDTIEAKFGNHLGGGVVSAIQCAASPNELGVLHVLWSEGGDFGIRPNDLAPALVVMGMPSAMRGQRINYSRWDAAGKTLDTDLAYAEEFYGGTADQYQFISADNWIYTNEMILRNDHGAPVAIVWPYRPDPEDSFGVGVAASLQAEFWDLSDGTADVLRTLDAGLIPTPVEAGGEVNRLLAGFFIRTTPYVRFTRSHYASSLYVDPRLGDEAVYLICVSYLSGDDEVKAFYRVPCDGSADFDYLDGIRAAGYSIIPVDAFIDPLSGSLFASDFVSDPDDVWMPSHLFNGGSVLQLDRQCLRGWTNWPAFPILDAHSGYESGKWFGSSSQPELISDDTGDWIKGGGTGPILSTDSTKPTNIAALKAKICRCCAPCNRTGMHVWEII